MYIALFPFFFCVCVLGGKRVARICIHKESLLALGLVLHHHLLFSAFATRRDLWTSCGYTIVPSSFFFFVFFFWQALRPCMIFCFLFRGGDSGGGDVRE